MFFVNAPCDVILTQWGIFSCVCPLKVHVKDILVYANAVIWCVCQNMVLYALFNAKTKNL